MSAIYSYTQLDTAEFSRIKKALLPVAIPLEQSPDWGNFDNSLTERTFLGTFRYDEDERLIAIASATLYTQKGRNWIWIKHGPIFATEPNTETIKKMCSTFKTQFSSVHSIQPLFIRLSAAHQTPPLTPPFEHTMYDETVVIDLTKSEDEILSNMSQGGRRGIRKAEKNNLKVESLTGPAAATLFKERCYRILEETATRDGFGVHPVSLYTSLLDNLSDFTKLYTISDENNLLAWAITTEYGKHALYYYGGSTREARDLHAPYLLHWEIIKAMKARGNKTYDFMGIAGKNYPSLANVTTFKLKFSKEITQVAHTFDLPLKPIKYRLFTTLISLKRYLRS